MSIWKAVKAVVLNDLFSVNDEDRGQDPIGIVTHVSSGGSNDSLGMGTYDGAANTPAIRAGGNSMAHQGCATADTMNRDRDK